MPTVDKNYVRIPLEIQSKAYLTDQLTSESPIVWRGTTTDIQVAVFKRGTVQSVSNVSSMSLEVKSTSDLTGATVIGPKTVSSFDDTTNSTTWGDYTKQHAVFSLSSAETNVTAGTYHLVVSGVTSGGAEITYGTALLTIKEDGHTTLGSPPPTTPTYYTSAEVNALLLNYVYKHRGATAISSGVSTVTVSGQSFGSTPVQVLCTVSKPNSSGYNLVATVLQDSLSSSGFTVELSGETDNANYKLHWLVIV